MRAVQCSGLTVRGLFHRAAGVTILSLVCLVGTGCNNALQGGASGAALGALAGLGIGSLTGDMGKGAAIGAIGGAVGGALIGDQNRRNANDY